MTTPRPHDALFKAAMEDPARAADLLRLVLPTEIVAHADLASLAVEPGSFVDPELADEHTDLLLSLVYRGRPALVYVLVEHKSTLDPSVFEQMLEYMCAVWRRERGSRAATVRARLRRRARGRPAARRRHVARCGAASGRRDDARRVA